MSRSNPQLRLRPRPISPYSAPTKTPERMDWDSSDRLGSVKPDMSGGDQLGTTSCNLLRPNDHPLAILDLLDAHQVVAEVADAVEAQLALQRVDLVRLQVGRDGLVVQALGVDDAGLQDLPCRV